MLKDKEKKKQSEKIKQAAEPDSYVWDFGIIRPEMLKWLIS